MVNCPKCPTGYLRVSRAATIERALLRVEDGVLIESKQPVEARDDDDVEPRVICGNVDCDFECEQDDFCRTCGSYYDPNGDGFQGECPSCAEHRDDREEE